jgi:hypothetical protein
MFNRRLLKVFNYAVLYAPPEEVQLGTGGREPLELDALRTAKGVEELLAVGLQLRLVVRVDEELLAIQDIRDIVLLGVVRHEPVDQPERNLGGAVEESDDFLLVRMGRIEAL